MCIGLKKWKRVLFSDEKKFNGPDEWNYYCRDLRKDTKFLNRRQMSGWGIGYHGRIDIKFIWGEMNAKNYLKLIGEQIERCATGK